MLQTNPKAKAIQKRLEAADRFIQSQAGKGWLESLPDRVGTSTTVTRMPTSTHAFFNRLSEWMAELFPALSFQAAYSDSKAYDVIKTFPSVMGDPYEAQLVQDSVGRSCVSSRKMSRPQNSSCTWKSSRNHRRCSSSRWTQPCSLPRCACPRIWPTH
jgi:hypothetical protein